MALTYWPEISATQTRIRGNELQRAWAEFLGRVPWQLFVTLTFDPKRWQSVDRSLAVKEAIWWCRQVGRLTRRPVAWLIAPERHRSGSWHAHVLLVGISEGIGPAPPVIWRQRCGELDIQEVYDGRRIVVYATKAAALSGSVELSDTLKRYRGALRDVSAVELHPRERVAA